MEGQTTGGDRLALAANEGLKIDAQGRAGPKVTLPGVPTLTAPPPQADIAYHEPRGGHDAPRLEGGAGGSGLSRARRHDRFVQPAGGGPEGVEDRYPWSCAASTWAAYFWQVAAIDKDGTQGSFSETSRFVVSQGAPRGAPPL